MAEKQRIEQERKEAEQREAEAERARAKAEAEVGRKWKEASPEARTAMIREEEAALLASGQTSTREAVGRKIGVSGKTIQTHVNT